MGVYERDSICSADTVVSSVIHGRVVQRFVPGSLLIQWHITDSCNLKCRHCYQEEVPAPEPSSDQLFALYEQIRTFIIRCRMANRANKFRAHITFTGGEPFIRHDFISLLQTITEDRDIFSFAVLTNGTLLTPDTARTLRGMGPSFVQVSIDGSRDYHDHLRGSGSHARTIEGIKYLVNEHVPVYISFTVNRDNFDDFPDVAEMGVRLGASRIWSDRTVPCARAVSNDLKTLTKEESLHFFGIMHRAKKSSMASRRVVSLHRALQFLVTGAKPYRCTAGATLLTVLPDGDIYPCRRLPVRAGNLFSNSMDEIYWNSIILNRLRDRLRISRGCELCFYARTCGGGARCQAYAVYGDLFRADPGCWLSTDGEHVQ